MALLALDHLVATGERVAGAVVVEGALIEVAPVDAVVAARALVAEAAVVRIAVAAPAGGLRLEEGRPARALLRVALQAAGGAVIALELPAGQVVIELLHGAAGPADELGAAADVLDVAVLARLAAVAAPVQAGAGGDAPPEVLVAVEAQAGHHLLARLVAAVAAGVAVEVLVRLRQRPRREELRRGRARAGHQRDHEHQRQPGAHENTHR